MHAKSHASVVVLVAAVLIGMSGCSNTPGPNPRDGGTGAICTDPVFETSDTNGGWSTEGYYVHNNMWNTSAGPFGPETLYACSYSSWYVISNQTNNEGAVRTFPNTHKDYDDVPVSSFTSLTSTFSGASPHVGIYNVAYDIWMNGVATNDSTEIMIWTDNYKQVPAGNKVTTATFNGQSYDVYKTSDNGYFAFVPPSPTPHGTLDLLAMFQWLIGRGWMASDSTVGQIGYGVEIVSTNGANARWDFTDFSITSTP